MGWGGGTGEGDELDGDGDTLWPRASGGQSRLVTRGAWLAHPRFFPFRRLRQLGGFVSPGCARRPHHTAYRRRTPALPLKDDCQVVNRQWFTANLRSQGGVGKGRGAGRRTRPTIEPAKQPSSSNEFQDSKLTQISPSTPT